MDSVKKYIFIIVSWVFVYFYPAFQFILLVGFFVIADSITGIMAAYKLEQEITSKKLRAIIPKYIVYGTGIFVAHVLQKQFFPDFPAMKLIAGLVAYTELVSIDENISKITGVRLFEFFIKKLKSK